MRSTPRSVPCSRNWAWRSKRGRGPAAKIAEASNRYARAPSEKSLSLDVIGGPKKTPAQLEHLFDDALQQTFPASDPVALTMLHGYRTLPKQRGNKRALSVLGYSELQAIPGRFVVVLRQLNPSQIKPLNSGIAPPSLGSDIADNSPKPAEFLSN